MAPFVDDGNLNNLARDTTTASPTLLSREATQELIRIGGDDHWTYRPDSGLFDLSRGSTQKLTLAATENDARFHHHRGVCLDPTKACLIIVDMQNYFIHPVFHAHPAGLAAAKHLLPVIEKCREVGIQVIWLNWVISEHDMRVMPPAVQRCFNITRIHERGHGWGVNLGAPVTEEQGGGRVLWKGSWNADIYGKLKNAMAATDFVFQKNRMSGLWRQEEPIHRYLRENGFNTLLFAGINTDQCLLSTMADAYSWGWDVIMLRDCTGTATKMKGAQELVEYNVAANMGFVVDSTALVDARPQSERTILTRNDSGIEV